jgi:hypothetical protein
VSRGSVGRGAGPALNKAQAEDLVVTLRVGELAAELAPIVHEAVRKAVAEVAAPPSEVLTRKQVAELLGVNPHHIPRLVERGMPAIAAKGSGGFS